MRISLTFGFDRSDEIKLMIPAQGLWTLGHNLREQVKRAEWDQPIILPAVAGTMKADAESTNVLFRIAPTI